MGVRSDRIPTFIVAATREELRSLFEPINLLLGEVHQYEVRQEIKSGEYEAWFYVFSDQISEINRFLEERSKRGSK